MSSFLWSMSINTSTTIIKSLYPSPVKQVFPLIFPTNRLNAFVHDYVTDVLASGLSVSSFGLIIFFLHHASLLHALIYLLTKHHSMLSTFLLTTRTERTSWFLFEILLAPILNLCLGESFGLKFIPNQSKIF